MKKLLVTLCMIIMLATSVFAVGENVWEHQVGGTILSADVELNGIAVDSSGSVFIVGRFWALIDFGGGVTLDTGDTSNLNSDIFVAKYDTSGVIQWAKKFSGTRDQIAYDIDVTAADDVVVVGYFQDTVDFGGGALVASGTDIFVLKLLGTNGDYVWAFKFGGTGIDYARAVKVESGGDIDITGQYGNFGTGVDFGGGVLPVVGNGDTFVVKLTSLGAHVWSKSFGAAGADIGRGIGADSSGNVYVAGSFQGVLVQSTCVTYTSGPTYTDIFDAKYSNTGTLIYFHQWGGPATDNASGIAVASDGTHAIAGNFSGVVSFGGVGYVTQTAAGDPYIAKYDSNGAFVWSKQIPSQNPNATTINAIAMDGSGNIVITGEMSGITNFGGGSLASDGTVNYYLAKYTSAGTHVWSKNFNATPTNIEKGFAVTFDSGGYAYTAGVFISSINFGTGVMTAGTGGDQCGVAKFNP